MKYLHGRGLYPVLLQIGNRELLFIGKRKDEDEMAKSTKTYEERRRALEKKEQESIEATKKLIGQRKELEKRMKAEESKK
ncbi:relaxasome subunit MobC, partial [Anaerobutyricum hallii]|nr:relaxasome subunit MobC [Anaerobutyricum hallii]